MGEAEVKSAALWLGKLLAEELKYLGGVTGKIETLEEELNTLAAFIMEAVKTRCQDQRVRTALSQARSLAYDCQDVIDTYILKVARHGYDQYEGGCQLGSALRWACIIREAMSVHRIRSEIDDLNSRIWKLKSDLVSYGITAQIPRDEIPRQLRRVYTHERKESVVVGLEQDVEALVERLMDPDDKTVIAITGMGGLGKSTLVAELYHHPKIRDGGYFQAFGWAHASRRLQPDRLLRTILYSLVGENDHERRAKIDRDIEADRAHAALYEMMTKVKCVVVVDDIWTSEDWAQIQAAFPRRTSTGSRLILTTRYQDILSVSMNLDQDQVHLHPITCLDDINSWELFQINAFPGGICPDATKKILGHEILYHCKGVPLAIVVLGKALKRKKRIEDWKQMQESISAQVKIRGAPHKPYEEIYEVLQVSFDELPHYLKNCFLHLANFYEDGQFGAFRLYHMWIGEGIVVKDPNNRSEEEEEGICERYLNELVSRNMVQVEERSFSGRIVKVRMHDLMRDVCTAIAKREGFFQAVNCPSLLSLKNALPSTRDKSLRSLAVYVSSNHKKSTCRRNNPVKVPSRAPNLRSLILFPIGEQGEEVDNTRLMETICEDYPLLRVFDCQGLKTTGKLSKKVGNLIHLRYLSLSGTGVTELSSSIEKLQFLQTLDLRVHDNVENVIIPNVLWKMKQLTHIYFPMVKELRKLKEKEKRIRGTDLQRYSIKGGEVLKLDGLCNLQTLICIDLDGIDLKDLSNLERLRRFYGKCETNKEFLHPLLESPSVSSLLLRVHAKIINEDSLILSICHVLFSLEIYVESYANIHLTQPLSLPNCLSEVSLWYVQLDEDPLCALEKHPNLRRLGLHMCYNGKKMACSASGFPLLTFLQLEGLPNFSEWEVEQGALGKLGDLIIMECPLKDIPDAIFSSANVHIRLS